MIDQTSNCKNKLAELKQEFDELDVRDRLETLLEYSDELPDLPQRIVEQRDLWIGANKRSTPVRLTPAKLSAA